VKAIVLTEPRRLRVVDDWPEPTGGPTEVVVQMAGIGLCGSDLSLVEGRTPVASMPWLIGHEGGGDIIEIGSDVVDQRLGERVVIEPNICCFACNFCMAGLTSACRRRRILGVKEPGIAAERVAVPAKFVHLVPTETTPATLACIEPWVVTNSAIRRAGVVAGDSCLILGAGSQALLLCLSLLAMGVTPDVVEPNRGRLALAEHLGGHPAPDGHQYRFVFETSGAPSVFAKALASVEPNGCLVVVGQSSAPVELTTRELVQRLITIRGSVIYDHPADFTNAVAQLRNGIDLTRVLRRRLIPDELDGDLDFVRDVPGKVWIDLTGWANR